MRPGSLPTATYRLQITPTFTLRHARAVLPDLAALGVSHLYLSPLLTSATGSDHGYDVVDHAHIDPARGGLDALRDLADDAHARGMGLILDIVPNHMCVSAPRENKVWWALLGSGPGSAADAYFDVDWTTGRLLLPVLGSVDDLDALRVVGGAGGPQLALDERRFPIAPGTSDGSARAVHDRQHYELADWHRGSTDLNYRRFFDISDLAAIRVEDDAVFDASHALVVALVTKGVIDGLRIDHPDGLADPAGYLARLDAQTGGVWTVVEKILAADETLPDSWATDGTTGYDAARLVTGVFVDPAGRAPLEELYRERTDRPTDFAALAFAGKLGAATGPLAAETARLARLVPDLPQAADALATLMASLGVYRSYQPEEGPARLTAALTRATGARPDLSETLTTLLPRLMDPTDPVCTRFQQTSGMVMAKGVEDTAFYRHHVLLALNEVGGGPENFGVSIEEWHREAARLQAHWPDTMTLLSSHDTKRSEDIRARLVLLSQVPALWAQVVTALSKAAAPFRGEVTAGDEYLLHQTAFGLGELDAGRVGDYLRKATREAKEVTSWLTPDEDYDRDLQALVRGALGDPDYATVLGEALTAVEVAWAQTVCAQKLLQLTMPGVPDLYQGSERTLLSLVDPDNRRPVDFTGLRATDEPKTMLTRAVLFLRRDRPELFSAYAPVHCDASAALAFARSADLVVVLRRFSLGVSAEIDASAEVALPAGPWQDVLTGAMHDSHALAAVLGNGPGVVLVRPGAADR